LIAFNALKKKFILLFHSILITKKLKRDRTRVMECYKHIRTGRKSSDTARSKTLVARFRENRFNAMTSWFRFCFVPFAPHKYWNSIWLFRKQEASCCCFC